jgi:hypothetical protein
MKNILMGTAAGMLIVAISGVAAAHAQVTYTNAVLNGCYGFMEASVDTQAGALNRDSVGTLCFDGNGNVTDASGHYSNTNGTEGSGSGGGGATYSVTNSPGNGMGTIVDTCSTKGFSVNSVDANGLAHGFQYILLSHTNGKKCKAGPLVIGGTAYYQGPSN